MSAINLSNIIWGVITVYVARKLYSHMSAKSEDKKTAIGEPPSMKDAQVDVAAPSIVPRGPYVAN